MDLVDFVPFETAKKLKAAGFDEPCGHYYCAFDNETDVRFWSIHPAQSQNGFTNPDGKVIADAPTLWQAQKWLREEKKLSVEPYANIVVNFNYSIADLTSFANKKGGGIAYDSYEAALSAGIDAALELILKGGEHE